MLKELKLKITDTILYDAFCGSYRDAKIHISAEPFKKHPSLFVYINFEKDGRSYYLLNNHNNHHSTYFDFDDDTLVISIHNENNLNYKMYFNDEFDYLYAKTLIEPANIYYLG